MNDPLRLKTLTQQESAKTSNEYTVIIQVELILFYKVENKMEVF